MDCHEPCKFKHEVNELRKRLEALDPERMENKLEKAQRSRLRAINERDASRRREEELRESIRKHRGEIESLKDRLIWAEEELQNLREDSKVVNKKLKRRIDELEKALSTAEWRLEKQARDLDKAHKKELKKLETDYEKQIMELEDKHQKEIAEKDAVIKALTEHPAEDSSKNKRTEAGSARNDSTNSSVPPGQDPNHATITNNREPTGKRPGGQPGHKAQPRKKLAPTDVVKLPPPKEVLENPDDYYQIGEIYKQVISVYIGIGVTEYIGLQYRNHKTRDIVHSEFPEGVGHLEVNYDESVEALGAYLHSVCNVPYNKIQELFNEAVGGEGLQISAGKLANLEKKFSSLSEKERNEVWGELFRSRIMNIDGTSMRIDGKQRQILVMRSGDTVMYRMTGCKGDKAVEGTPAEHYRGTVVSDGESTFTKLGSSHQGCLVHEGRYLRHAEEVAPGLEWSRDMRDLMKGLQHRRNLDMAKNIWKMPAKERKQAGQRYEEILRNGLAGYEGLCGCLLHQQLLSNKKRLGSCAAAYDIDFDVLKKENDGNASDGLDPEVEKALRKDVNTLIRLMADKDDYLLFLGDYTIPPHNNDAEKAARTVKIHAKPNGGMRSEEYAGYYADVATVLETEHMHGRSRFSKMKEVFSRSTEKN